MYDWSSWDGSEQLSVLVQGLVTWLATVEDYGHEKDKDNLRILLDHILVSICASNMRYEHNLYISYDLNRMMRIACQCRSNSLMFQFFLDYLENYLTSLQYLYVPDEHIHLTFDILSRQHHQQQQTIMNNDETLYSASMFLWIEKLWDKRITSKIGRISSCLIDNPFRRIPTNLLFKKQETSSRFALMNRIITCPNCCPTIIITDINIEPFQLYNKHMSMFRKKASVHITLYLIPDLANLVSSYLECDACERVLKKEEEEEERDGRMKSYLCGVIFNKYEGAFDFMALYPSISAHKTPHGRPSVSCICGADMKRQICDFVYDTSFNCISRPETQDRTKKEKKNRKQQEHKLDRQNYHHTNKSIRKQKQQQRQKSFRSYFPK